MSPTKPAAPAPAAVKPAAPAPAPAVVAQTPPPPAPPAVVAQTPPPPAPPEVDDDEVETAAAPATLPDGRPVINIGDKVRLRGVFGRIENPNTLVMFNIDKSHKVEVDMWTKLEYEAGKLAIDD